MSHTQKLLMKGACWIPVFLLFVAENLFGQVTGDFRSRLATGNWNAATSWEQFDGTVWVSPAPTTPAGSETITIRSGHNITINTIISLSGTISVESSAILTIGHLQATGTNTDFTVQLSGVLTINSGGLLTTTGTQLNFCRIVMGGNLTNDGTINMNTNSAAIINGILSNTGTWNLNHNAGIVYLVNGIVENSGGITDSRLNFNAGSFYEHSYTTSAGSIPLSTWNAGSTCIVSGYTTNNLAPANLDQVFDNFVWNTPDLTQNIDLGGAFTFLNSLTIASTGNSVLTLSASNDYGFAIGADLSVSGTASVIFSEDAVGLIQVGGNFLYGSSSPLITVSGSGSVTFEVYGNVNLSSTSASFTAPEIFAVGGNFTNDGNFVHNNGLIRFMDGSGLPQALSGNSVSVFNNMEVQNTLGVLVEGEVHLAGILTLNELTSFDADGNADLGVFVLQSSNDSPTADASIAPIPADATFTGNVTVQRYMSIEGANNGRIYRYISSPVTNATVADLQNEIPVTGSFTGASSCSGCVSANQSMWSYNEAVTTGTLNDGYVDFPNTANTETFEPGVGYIFFVRGDLLGLDAAWDLTGPINQGDVVFDVSFTSSSNDANDGWNLVGNPYPSAIDWDAAEWTKSGLNGTIYMRDNGNGGQVATYTTGSGGVNGGSNIIAMGQGFWVKADNTATAELIATESVKVSGTSPEFFRKTPPKDLLKVALTNNIKRDEMLLHFREGASEGYDKGDALKLKNSSVFNLASLADEKLMAINSLPPIGCARSIELSLSEVTPGDYSLEFSELESFNAAITSIVLKDNFLDSMLDVNMENKSYEFSITNAPESYGNGRFSLIFTEVNPEIALTEFQEVCVESESVITISDSQPTIFYAILAGEETIAPESEGNGDILTINIPKDKLSLGENQFVLRSYLSGCYAETMHKEFIVKVIEPPVAKVESMGFHCNEGSVTLEVSGAGNYGTYNWYLKENSAQPVEGQHASIFITPVLNKPETYYVSAVNSIGCDGPRVPVTANIIRYDPVVISTEPNGLLYSSYEEGNQWFFNGEIVPGATGASFTPYVSGEYKVEVSLGGGCTTTYSLNFNIEQVTEAEQNLNGGITLYPNPVESVLILRAPSDMKINGSAIFNTMGQQIGKVAFTQGDGAVKGKYDMALTPPGIYFVIVTLESGKMVQLSVYKK